MAKSPSVTLKEKDKSGYAVTSADTILAVVGYGEKGKLNEPVTITSKTEFISTYGTPPPDSPYSHLAVYRAFNQTNKIIYYRVGDTAGTSGDTAARAESVITGDSGDSYRVRVLIDEFGSGWNGSFININSRANPVGDTYWDIDFYSGDSTLLESFNDISWNSGDTNFFETKINADEDNGGSSYFSVDTHGGGGGDGDSIIVITAGTYVIGEGDTAGDTNYYITGDTWTAGDSQTTGYDFRPGADGVPTNGDSALLVAALSTTSDLANDELWNYHILITPDSSAQAVADAAVTLAAYRKDFIYIADPPYGLSYTNVANWHNGTASQGRTTALNTSYAAAYWPWLKDYNVNVSEYVWCPPSVFVAEKYLEVDRNYGPWYACAGDVRGKILAFDYETSPSFAQREVLYGDLNAINPIVNFASKGLEIFGQKTLLRATTALNRVNVRRMVIYAKKLIKTAMDQIVFEPHNADSWARATNLINSILEPIRQANGLDDYRVTIDETTNTADLIAQNIMKGVIQLVPTGTIEIIELSINILSPGATIQ